MPSAFTPQQCLAQIAAIAFYNFLRKKYILIFQPLHLPIHVVAYYYNQEFRKNPHAGQEMSANFG
jgi:hypothetical protein